MQRTARPVLSVGIIKCFPEKGSFKIKLEGQLKTQAEKNGGKLREHPKWEVLERLRN